MANPLWALGSDQHSSSVRRPHFAKREAVARASVYSRPDHGGDEDAPRPGQALSTGHAPLQIRPRPAESVGFTNPPAHIKSGDELLSHLASQLTVISAYIGVAQQTPPESHNAAHAEALADAQRELRVAATAMRSLRALLELPETCHSPKSLNAIVEQILSVLKPRLQRLRLRTRTQLECSPACRPQDANLGPFLLVIMEQLVDWCRQHPDAPRCITIHTLGDTTNVEILVAVGTENGKQNWSPLPASVNAAAPDNDTFGDWTANLNSLLKQLTSPAGLQSIQIGFTANHHPTPVCQLQFSMEQAEEAPAWTR